MHFMFAGGKQQTSRSAISLWIKTRHCPEAKRACGMVRVAGQVGAADKQAQATASKCVYKRRLPHSNAP